MGETKGITKNRRKKASRKEKEMGKRIEKFGENQINMKKEKKRETPIKAGKRKWTSVKNRLVSFF